MICNNHFWSCKSVNLRRREGQSLIEVVIGLAIGSILIGAAAFAISTMLQSNLSVQKGQSATAIAQELLNKARAYGSANWHNVYDLAKASSTHYFLNASGTEYAVLRGNEGVLDGDVVNGLVAEWKFDEDAATTSTLTYDATGSGNNGILSNVTRATSTCKIANCLNFNGTNSSMQVAHNATLEPASVTVSAWVNLTSKTTRHLIATKWQGYTLEVNAAGYPYFQIWNGAQVGNISNVPIAFGSWAHVVGVFDVASKTVSTYVNGANTASLTTGAGIVYSGAALVVSNCAYNCAQGYIDDMRIYNRALSADEVRQLYNSNVFSRYFYVENVCRTDDALSSVSGVAPCGAGSSDDPSTQKITVATEWTTGRGAGQVLLSDLITRWKNAVFQQTDWSGGASASGPILTPGNTFSSSSGVNVGGGAIRIQGL